MNINSNFTLPYGCLVQRSGRGPWYWKYTDQASGNRLKKSTKTEDKHEAYLVALRWCLDGIGNEPQQDQAEHRQRTLGDVIEAYDSEYAHTFSAQYQKNRANYMRTILDHFGRDTLVKDIRSSGIAEWTEILLAKDLTPKTVNKYLSNLMQVLKYAAHQDWIERVPLMKRVREQKRVVGIVLTDEQCEKLLRYCELQGIQQFKEFVALGLYAGLRWSEAKNLRYEDIDWENGLIHLRKQKNGSDAPAPLKLVAPYLDRNGTGLVCPVISEKSLRICWDRVRHGVGAPGLRYHDLRHTFATRAFEKLGMRAQKATRHSNAYSFMVYAHTTTKQVFDEL